MKSIIERFDKKVVHLPFDRQLLRLLRHFIHSGMHLSHDNRLVGVFCAVDVCHARVASVGGQRYRSHHHRHHCAQPVMDRFGIQGMVRASFGLYNTKEEVDALVAGVKRVSQMF